MTGSGVTSAAITLILPGVCLAYTRAVGIDMHLPSADARTSCCMRRGAGVSGQRMPSLLQGSVSVLPCGEVSMPWWHPVVPMAGAVVPVPQLHEVLSRLCNSWSCCNSCLFLVHVYGLEGAVLPQFPMHS